jgi:PAS domain S-box-containing protein
VLTRARRRPHSASPTSADQFRTIFESVTDGILIFEPDGRIIEVNPVVCERLGYTREQLLTMSILQLDTSESAGLFESRIARVLREGEARFEVEHVRKDGSVLPLEVGSRVMEFDGRTAILSVQRDITERRRAQADAQEQSRFVTELLDAIPAPIVAKDIEGRIRLCNRAFSDGSARRRGDILGKTIGEMLGSDASELDALDRAVIETGLPKQQEVTMPVADRLRRVLLTRSALRASDGAAMGTVTTAVDITDRYEAEQALRQSEERFRTLFESASDSIFMADPTGRFLDVNRAAAECLGYTKAEMLSMGLADICAPEMVPVIPERIAAIFQRGSMGFETTHVRRDGTLLPVELAVTVMQLEGQPVMLGIARDVSERKRAESERALLEDQLRQAQKMEGIGRLASGIAHDFNNLLTAIGGYAGLAASGLAEGDERRKDIEQIQQASDRAASLVRQLLLFARGNTLEPKVIRLGDVIARLEPMLKRLIGEDVELTVRVAACRRSVLADPGQVEQVILNLAVNSRDAMRRGGRLDIRVADVDVDEETAQAVGIRPGPNSLLEVADTGTGMDPATLEHLFEPFFTTKGPGEGTGLGLATVYGIVRQARGGIRVRSELGRGSTFAIYLPSVDGAGEEAAGARPSEAEAGVGRGRRILVVEDNDAVRSFTVRVLEDAGYQVFAAEAGATAVRIGGDVELDLLLTDVIMPSMRGAEVADELRALQPHLPVLYMSGYSDRALDSSGNINYLPKPFSPAELLGMVEKVLSDRSAAY